MGPCLDDDQIAAFAEGAHAPTLGAEVLAHLDECAACHELVADLVRTFDLAPPPPPSDDLATEPLDFLAPGTTVGRYVALHPLGAGGMGVVYLGYDPELDRKVAIKLVRPEAAADDERAQERLLREAQALARLAHPNVVAVHDVGAWRSGIFLAMEYVEGQSLAAFLDEKRPWREVLAVFAAAGAGLAAAHRTGLVHRDFKPANVLVGKDGRVRVTDFGLARAVEEIQQDSTTLDLHPGDDTPQVTRRAGTPAYMAPEELAGDPVDARADQYSFCVALAEALGAPRSKASISGGAIVVAPPSLRAARAPAWVLRAVERGLAKRASARWASMDELLAALARDPWRARTRGAVALGVATLVLGGAGLVVGRDVARKRACAHEGASLSSVWTADRKAALERAFHESGKPYAADALRSVEAALDRYAIGLAMMQTESCEATRVRGEQSEEMRGLRAACLDDRRAAFASFVDTLATGDGANVAAAIPGVHALPPVAACGDLDALRAGARRRKPHDAATQARLDALARALTDTEGAYEAGALSSLRERTDRLVADARELADPALLGRALTLRGSVRYQTQQEQVAIPDFRDAAWAALAAGDDEGVARACTGLIDLTLHTDDAQTARTWRDCARAAVTRLGAPPDLDSTVTLSEADLVDRDGDLDGGTHLRRRAIELIEQADGKDSLRLIQPLDNLAIGLEERGLVDEALPIARRAVALGEKQVGPSVPMVARARMTLGSIHATLHQLDDATRELTRARTDLAAELGEDSPDVAAADDILAGVLSDEKRWDEALALYTRALDVRRRKLGPRHPFVGRSLANIGITQVSRGRWAEGIAALEEALPLLDRDGDSDESSTAIVLSSLGEAQIGAGQPSAALPTLARARALLEKHGDDADTLAKAEFQTARALSQIGREPAEARRLAQSARTRLAAEKAPADEIANVDQWLAQHPSSTSGSIR